MEGVVMGVKGKTSRQTVWGLKSAGEESAFQLALKVVFSPS